jgi:hypothetical protein
LILIISDGTNSNVCEFNPSGTRPIKLILSPPIFWTIFVIGVTEVTTFSLSVSWVVFWACELVKEIKKTILSKSREIVLILSDMNFVKWISYNSIKCFIISNTFFYFTFKLFII